jgi:hypothetical protein
MISDVKSPRPPFSKGGETSLARHFLQLPPFAKGDGGGFSCVGATNIQVMSVYESIKFNLALSQTEWVNNIPSPSDGGGLALQRRVKVGVFLS